MRLSPLRRKVAVSLWCPGDAYAHGTVDRAGFRPYISRAEGEDAACGISSPQQKLHHRVLPHKCPDTELAEQEQPAPLLFLVLTCEPGFLHKPELRQWISQQ